MCHLQFMQYFTSSSKVSRRFNKFKISMKDLKDLHRKEHPITETSRVNIEGLGLLSKTITGLHI